MCNDTYFFLVLKSNRNWDWKKSLFQWWFQVILNGTKNNNGLDLCTLSKISSAYKQNRLIYLKLFNFRLFCSVVFHWPSGKIYCKNSFFQFVRGKIRKFDIKVEKWEGVLKWNKSGLHLDAREYHMGSKIGVKSTNWERERGG